MSADKPFKDSFLLQGSGLENTFYFYKDELFYTSLDPRTRRYSISCYSIKNRLIKWTRLLNDTMAVKSGAILATGEFIIPTMSRIVYLLDSGEVHRQILLNDRCNISPLSYKNLVILHDRGQGVLCLDLAELDTCWLIAQDKYESISQPIIINNMCIILMDDYLSAVNPENGVFNWKFHLKEYKDSYVNMLYGYDEKYVYILSTNLLDNHHITCVSSIHGEVIWESKVPEDLDIWDVSMVVRKETVYCKSKSGLICLNKYNGSLQYKNEFDYTLSTNLIIDCDDNLIFGITNNTLIYIDTLDINTIYKNIYLNRGRFFKHRDDVFLYSYPNLYQLGQSQSR